MNFWYSYTKNFSRDVFCLNENDFKANLVPNFLDIDSNPFDCRLLCHLYLQLRLDKKMRVRMDERCLNDHEELFNYSLNAQKIELVRSNYSLYMNRFNSKMCQPREYYSCNYSKENLVHLNVNWNVTSPRTRTSRTTSTTISTTSTSTTRTIITTVRADAAPILKNPAQSHYIFNSIFKQTLCLFKIILLFFFLIFD